MRHGQRFGYMILGALIMLVGLGIGAIVSPPLIAQNALGRIRCTGLTVVNAAGEIVMALEAEREGGAIAVTNKTKTAAAVLTTEEKLPGLYLVDKETNAKAVISINEDGAGVTVSGDTGFGHLSVTEDGGGVLVRDEGKGSIFLHIFEGKGKITIK